jgi:hypothetical protein
MHVAPESIKQVYAEQPGRRPSQTLPGAPKLLADKRKKARLHRTGLRPGAITTLQAKCESDGSRVGIDGLGRVPLGGAAQAVAPAPRRPP